MGNPGETGPQLGFLLAANVKSGGSGEDVKSSYKLTDFSWAFGLGYMIPSISAGIDARYNLGLSKILQLIKPQGIRSRTVFSRLVYFTYLEANNNRVPTIMSTAAHMGSCFFKMMIEQIFRLSCFDFLVDHSISWYQMAE